MAGHGNKHCFLFEYYVHVCLHVIILKIFYNEEKLTQIVIYANLVLSLKDLIVLKTKTPSGAINR